MHFTLFCLVMMLITMWFCIFMTHTKKKKTQCFFNLLSQNFTSHSA